MDGFSSFSNVDAAYGILTSKLWAGPWILRETTTDGKESCRKLLHEAGLWGGGGGLPDDVTSF